MSTVPGLRFGPLALRVEGPALHPLLDAYRAPVAAVFVPSDVEGDALRRGEDGP